MNNSMINFLTAASRLGDYDKEDDFVEEPDEIQNTDKPVNPDSENVSDTEDQDPKARIDKDFLYNVKKLSVSSQVYSIKPTPHPYLYRNSSINSLLPEDILQLSNSDVPADSSCDSKVQVEAFQKKSLDEKNPIHI
ncbi:hypothetical protein DSO57_1020095 [Entomophthora muscae]|uniref:Uncharacterized protein n=1 Tax=Entomophthora muscae TaxID=34485 RepID=A0ACC2T421_9FUNG|nr:hypothetical protein DSO57_1020095 [Entomophthora muscae]